MIDKETARKQAMAFFADIISREAEKPDEEANFMLIEDCEKMLLALTKKDKQLKRSISDLPSRMEQITQQAHKPNRFVGARKIPIRIAVVLCTVMMLVVGVGAACIFDEDLRSNLLSLFGKEIGTTVTVDSVEYINGGITKYYDSIEDLLQDNNLSIQYPNNDNSSLVVGQVLLTEEVITLLYRDGNSCIAIYAKDDSDIDGFTKNAAIHEINGKLFYVSLIESQWTALLFDETYAYYITCDSEENLKHIMNEFN